MWQKKLWSSGKVLSSRLEGRGIDPRPMLDGSGVKAIPGSINAPIPGSFNIRKERKYRKPNGAHQKKCKKTFRLAHKVW
jgi:hypothetical protein